MVARVTRSGPTAAAGAVRPRWTISTWTAGTWALVAGIPLAVVLVVVASVLAGAKPYAALGNTDPGVLVWVGAPLVRVLVDIAASLSVGSLAFAVWCTAPDRNGSLTSTGYAAVRTAGRWAAIWCVASLVAVPFDAADLAGQPLSAVLPPDHLFGLVGALEEPKAWLVSAVLAAVVAAGCRMTLRWRPCLVLLPVAVLALLPVLATGHSSSDAGHDIAIGAIMIHVPAAAIWLGVLVAFVRHARRHKAGLATIGRRYARIAEVCFLVLLVSGLIDAAVLVPVGALVSTGYGLVLMAITVVALAVGVGGALLRRRVLSRLAGQQGWRGLGRLAGAELVALLAVVGASVILTHLPPPAFVGRPVTPDETLLGYNLAGPPTLVRLLLDWRVEVFMTALAVTLAGLYLVGVWAARRNGLRWPVRRTASWLAGCAVLVIATSSGIGRYAEAMFSLHIASHMLISMLAPLLLALGGPLTLADSALPHGAGVRGLPGPRDWLDALRESPLTRLLTHPVVAVAVFGLAPFALYFTGLFDAAVRFHWAHLAIDVVFLVIGYLFAWAVIGVDPTPRPLPALARLGMLLAAMPFDILFGALLISTRQVIGNGTAGANMYTALALPWVSDLLADQRVAGEIALGLGEVSLLLAIAVLALRWHEMDDAADIAGPTGGQDAALDDYRHLLAEATRRREARN
ncbi:MAG TPA: cytochrome c oxidase assembly protein [Pseudonocardiaceae bacterium]